MKKFLNSNGDALSVTSRNSRDSSERDFSIPKDILRELELQMLHGDLKRDSFRARSGTRNFCLNPLFEEGFAMKTNGLENESNYEKESFDIHQPKTFPSTTSSLSSLDEMKSKCVENIFLDLLKVRRNDSIKSSESDRPSFVVERCHSLKRRERRLK